MLIYMVCSFD